MMDKNQVNMGSPIGPGFVVYERAPGEYGYDLEMAKASVGEGWWPLLEDLFKAIAWNKEHNPMLGFGNVVITQVKEKYGTLRVYYSGGNPPGSDTCNHWNYVDGYISALTSLSGRICEECGAPGRTCGHGWIRTTCKPCADKHGWYYPGDGEENLPPLT